MGNLNRYKFRAWDGERMVYDSDYENKRQLGAVLSNFETNLMQFTGLLDKSGKEIYEGDIVKDLDNNLISVIIWEKAGFMQSIKIAYERLSNKDYRKPEWEGGITGLASGKGLEIIGDIYSNPELIK